MNEKNYLLVKSKVIRKRIYNGPEIQSTTVKSTLHYLAITVTHNFILVFMKVYLKAC